MKDYIYLNVDAIKNKTDREKITQMLKYTQIKNYSGHNLEVVRGTISSKMMITTHEI